MSLILQFLLVVVCTVYGADIPWAEQEPIYTVLLQVSALVFAVMGAWIAILYPGGLRELMRAKSTAAGEVRQVKQCLSAMIWATGIVSATLFVHLLAPVVKQFEIPVEWQGCVRAISMGFVAFLVGIQLWTLILTLVPVYHVDGKIARAVESEASLQRRTGGVRRKPPK